MFFPHQPEPISAVRYFFAGSAARMKGALAKAAPAASEVWRKVRREECMAAKFLARDASIEQT
jgi:hypothetical protein